jgi:hypothetical protein
VLSDLELVDALRRAGPAPVHLARKAFDPLARRLHTATGENNRRNGR